jgi:hypothetical protein
MKCPATYDWVFRVLSRHIAKDAPPYITFAQLSEARARASRSAPPPRSAPPHGAALRALLGTVGLRRAFPIHARMPCHC